MFPARLAAYALAALVGLCGSAGATPITGQGTWETTLRGRDAAGREVDASSAEALFLYDSALNVTWLRDTAAYGSMTWPAAMAFAANLSIGGFGGWRLPAMVQPGVCDGRLLTGCIVDQQSGHSDAAWSELAYLWTVELGNPLGVSSSAANTGDFFNLDWYVTPGDSHRWLATLALPVTPQYSNLHPWMFWFGSGTVLPALHQGESWDVMLLRDGDVLTVASPSSLALLLLSLGILRCFTRNTAGRTAAR